jgi:hypothetical protein
MGNVCINDTEIFFPFFLHVLALSLFWWVLLFFLSFWPAHVSVKLCLS